MFTKIFLPVLVFMFSGISQGLCDAPGVTDKEIVLGMTQPLSGPAAAWGSISMGVEAWMAHINETAGGIHGRKIRIVVKDDGYNPSKGVANVKEMKDEVFAMVGIIGTAVINALKDDLAEYGIPVVMPLGNTEIWASQPKEKVSRIFASYPHYEDEGNFLASYAIKTLGKKKIAVFYQNDDYGKGGLAGTKIAVKKLGQGAKIVAEMSYEVSDREMGTHALKLRESKAEAIILYSTITHGATLIKEMTKVGYRPQVLAPFPLGDHLTMFKLLGTLWEGAYYNVTGSVPGEPDADRVLKILLKHKPELKGKEIFGLTGATIAMVAAEGLRKTGKKLTRQKFAKAMERIKNFSPENLGPPVSFGKDRHHGLNTVRLMKAVNAKSNKVEQVTDYQIFEPHF